ncbi:MAG: flagellar basal body rod protein FlgB [Butyrivibrio sp.]|nr:flagellar basal body rod protein FlgB [Butyrivibrio sp.]
MINSGAFAYVDLLTASADYAWKRNEVLGSNMSNVNTPGYKRQDVSFESVLSAAVARASSSSRTLTQTVRNINYNALKPTVYTDNSNLSYRLDGNNVDVDVEQIEIASNQYYYKGIIDSMNQEFSRFSTVLATT